MVFLRSSFWSLNSGSASSKHSVNRETCGKTGILSDLKSLLYMDCNSATIKENLPCIVPLQNVLFFENAFPPKNSLLDYLVLQFLALLLLNIYC